MRANNRARRTRSTVHMVALIRRKLLLPGTTSLVTMNGNSNPYKIAKMMLGAASAESGIPPTGVGIFIGDVEF